MKKKRTYFEFQCRRQCQLLVFVFCLLLSPARGENQGLLSEKSFVSLLTCGAGTEVETFFGHTAIRVCDPAIGIDMVYNYGTYDFDQPHFYWSFTRGNLDYCLSRTSYAQFLESYCRENRSVYEQRLLLSPQERENMWVMLETNHQPEYRNYRYDFFRDNCATRPRDIIESALGRRTLHYADSDDRVTYRSVIYEVTREHLWWRLAFDIVLGIPTDHVCDIREQLFAPPLLMEQMAHASLDDGSRIADTIEPVLPEPPIVKRSGPSPLVASWCLMIAILALSILALRYGWRLRWLDFILYLAASLIALLLLFLWLGTNHFYTNWNLNLLWASPLYIYFLIRGTKSRTWVVALQLALLLLTLIVVLTGWPQHMNSAIVPIALIYFFRLTILLHQQLKQ